MQDNDKTRFAEIMLGLAENFSAALTKAGLSMRFDALREFTIDQISAAANKILKNRTMMGMPTVAEFIVAINGGRENSENAASLQVNAVMQQIRQIGSYGQPVFDDPITKKLMSSRWSWRSVCSMTEVELKWWAKEFSDAYQAFQKNENQLAIENNELSPKLRLLVGGISK